MATFLYTRDAQLLAVGEPTHAAAEPAFTRLRNRIFEQLVERGFRSIAIESDRVAGLTVDAYVRGGPGTADSVLAEGFSHGWGEHDANRELVEWMRSYNASRPPEQQLSFHGFDAPTEITGGASPLPYLRTLRDHLGVEADLDGEDEPWTDPAAMLEAGKSIGRSETAARLRVLTEDWLTLLYGLAPTAERAAWQRARVHGEAARGLLAYHAQMADTAPGSERIGRLLQTRDALMARNLLDIRADEQHRGPTLVFAHNSHLQRNPSQWSGWGMQAQWNSAGSIVAALLGDRYAFVAGSLGASGTMGLPAPEPDSFDALLAGAWFTKPELTGTPRPRTADYRSAPMDAQTFAHCDAVWHVDRPATVDGVAARILDLPGVTQLIAGPENDAPQSAWGDRFFYAGPDRQRPFATIVVSDYPGFDEQSRLNRPGVFRLNLELGRDEFRKAFGYGPEEFAARRDGIDFTEADRLLPHPVYAVQGWACVIQPGPVTATEVERLLGYAQRRSAARQRHSTR